MKNLIALGIALSVLVVYCLVFVLLMPSTAHGFTLTLENEVGQATSYYFSHEVVPNDRTSMKVIAKGKIEKDEIIVIEFPDFVRPAIYQFMWLAPDAFGVMNRRPWIRLWLYENALAMEVRLVAGRGWHPSEIIKFTAATPL